MKIFKNTTRHVTWEGGSFENQAMKKLFYLGFFIQCFVIQIDGDRCVLSELKNPRYSLSLSKTLINFKICFHESYTQLEIRI